MANKVNLRICLAISMFLLVMAGLAQAATITVGPEAAYDFDTIQPGIDAAVDGDTVLVAPGEYVITEPVTFRGKAITVQSEAGRDETTIRMGTVADTNRGSVVIFENNETDASVLDGFTITGGRGCWVAAASAYAGGGIYFDASSGAIRNCAIVQNRVEVSGSGVFCAHQCTPILIDCIIAENSAGDSGGGVFAWSGASLTMTNCIIRENLAERTGSWGGVGGGVLCYVNSSMTMTDCIIAENSAGRGGGGVFCGENSSSVTLTRCIIVGNTAGVGGGGLEIWHQASAALINCVIAQNTTAAGGGIICNPSGYQGCSVTVTNSIIWGNEASNGREIRVENPATFSISYSNVDGGQTGVSVEGGSTLDWGAGNIDADPLFASLRYRDNKGTREPSDDVWVPADYHLKSQAGRWDPNSQTWIQDDMTSPCIDAADPNSDWTAELWPHGERTNMGAYGGTREASMSTHPEVMSLPRVAFIYGSDSEAAESFQSLLVGYGCLTTLIALDDVLATPLDSYDLVIVGDDTEDAAAWNNPQVVPAIEGSGRPIIGMGEGGYDFFGMLELSIGRPHGMHDSRNSIDVIDPNHLIFIMPYPIDVPEDRILQLYTETNEVTLYLWPVPENVKVLAGEVDQNGYYPLAFEPDRYVLWGFTEPPQKMTEVGKDLFINIVIWTANAGWEMEI
jgi:hypothetical protein